MRPKQTPVIFGHSHHIPNTPSMAASSSTFHPIIVILLVSLTLAIAINNNIILDDDYTVTTILDGNKLSINPNAVIAMYGSSSDLIILDYVNSGFYTASFFNSQVSEIKNLSGNGNVGYMDGDLRSAMFNKPKSFAIDRKNNIYIADKANHVIRKISKSGVTTIAGGNVQKTGKADGPAQNATFSDEFELAFDPQRCALLISDHGSRLIRQLELKAEDCTGSSSGSVLGSTAAWGIGMGVACLVGLIIGFAVRPYILPHEASGHHHLNVTWKHYLINLEKQAVTFYFVTRNAIASHNKLYQVFKKVFILSFSQLSLVLGLNIVTRPPPTPVKPVSLLDCDDVLPTPMKSGSFLDYDHLASNETTKTQDLVDELNSLITFDGTPKANISLAQETAYKAEEKNENFPAAGGKIDRQIYANFAGFVEGSKKTSSVESWEISY